MSILTRTDPSFMHCCRSARPLALSRKHSGLSVPCRAVDASVTPSSSTASSRLQDLQRYSVVLSDEVTPKVGDVRQDRASTAVVTFALLADILATSALTEYSNAIESGVTYGHHEGGTTNDSMDHALVNIGCMLKERVSGRIVTEVDPRLANDAGALEQRARSIVDLYASRDTPKESLLMQLPATWAGLQAVKELEASGIQCEVTDVYSFSQAVAAVLAKASVIVANIRRINLWYDQHPGAIRDPKGPREDAGAMNSVNVGVRMASAMYDFSRQSGDGTKLVVCGIRTAEEAMQVSGADYLVLPEKITKQLQESETLQGYNDGLSATGDVESEGIPGLTPEKAAAHNFRDSEVAQVSEKDFEEDLGMAGRDLLTSRIAASVESIDRVAHFIDGYAVSRE